MIELILVLQIKMVQKRPFDNEETFDISSKHPKQVEPRDQLFSFSESVFPRETSQKPYGSVEDAGQDCSGCGEKLDTFHEFPIIDGSTQTAVAGSLSVSSWSTGSTSDEDNVSQLPIYLPWFPEYFSRMSPMRTFVRCEDIYRILLENSPRKSVAIGPNHQADVLPWDAQERKCPSNDPDKADDDSRSRAEDEDQLILMGTCVVPMPNMRSSPCDEELGKSRIDCSCEDKGSIRCARQHILEGREKLVNSIGQERFIGLGLNEVGEQVAEKWSAEEAQLFHQTVFSNPSSLGKNFWNNLSASFPSRTKKEIVNYYFNVFMLRKRAEQNRNKGMSIDSDNDEWQGHDDFVDNGLGMHEDGEDSIVESCVSHNAHDLKRHDLVDYDEHATDTDANPNSNSVLPDPIAKSGSMNSNGKCLGKHLLDRTVWDERCVQGIKDGKCASSDTERAVKANNIEDKKNTLHSNSKGIINSGHE